MDRYLRNRNRGKAFDFVRNSREHEPSWFGKLFSPRIPDHDLAPQEEAELKAMETEIKKGEARLERATPAEEPKLEEEQEQRVTMYQQFLKLFKREHQLEDAYTGIQEIQAAAPDETVTRDFRKLAEIQVRWLERLPTRVKDEFRESEDYATYVEILQRRGVAKKR
jgi:hypothetical protein